MEMNQNPLVDGQYLLEKFPGKGGWTYAKIPEIPQDKHAHFGWVKVSGSIDFYEIKKMNLMPMGNGQLFLSVKTEIRKKINKQAGDYVKVVLYADREPDLPPQEWLDCLMDEPTAYTFFDKLLDEEKKSYIQFIYSAKTDQTKVERMGNCIEMLLQGMRRCLSVSKAKETIFDQ